MFNQKDSSDAAFEFLNDKGFFCQEGETIFPNVAVSAQNTLAQRCLGETVTTCFIAGEGCSRKGLPIGDVSKFRERIRSIQCKESRKKYRSQKIHF